MIGLLKKIKQTPAARQVESKPKPTPAQNIQAPEPANLGPEYTRIWNQAWRLAEWIDDPAAAPFEVRRAKLPELDRLRAEMDAIVQADTNVSQPENLTTTSDSEEIKQIKRPGTWHTWESSTATTRDRTPENCPARCKRTGKCYGTAYFEGKTAPAAVCRPENCKHIASEGNEQ